MPVRLLRDWTDSEAVNRLTPQAERLFTRLLMKADDFGRYIADPKLLRPLLFPLLVDRVSERDLRQWLEELVAAGRTATEPGLVVRYTVGGKEYLVIPKFGQRMRLKRLSKYPDPSDADPNGGDDDSQNDGRLPASGGRVTACGGDVRPETRDERRETRDENTPNPLFAGEPIAPEAPRPTDLVQVYNANRGPLPEAKGIGGARERHARARLAEVADLERWGSAVARMASSAFCRGENDRSWRADLDFLLRPGTLAKVEEGKYDDRRRRGPALVGENDHATARVVDDHSPEWVRDVAERLRSRANDLDDNLVHAYFAWLQGAEVDAPSPNAPN